MLGKMKRHHQSEIKYIGLLAEEIQNEQTQKINSENFTTGKNEIDKVIVVEQDGARGKDQEDKKLGCKEYIKFQEDRK